MSLYSPNWLSLETHPIPGWFKDAKFGIYVHWGPYSVPAFDSEWYPRRMYLDSTDAFEHHRETYGHPADHGYRKFISEFGGESFDADSWAELFADAGAEFVGITAIHHDGFALWDSDSTRWNTAEMGPQRDIVAELATAVRNHGMKFVAAFHHAWRWWYFPRESGYDTMDPDYAGLYGQPHEEGESPPESYFEDWKGKIIEVIDDYRPDLLWFDFGWGNEEFIDNDRYRREVVAYYYNAAEKWGKPVDVVHKRNLPVGVGILDYERRRREQATVQPWLTDTSIDYNSWSYIENPDYKSTKTLLDGIIDRASKNGVTMLNVGPRPDGTIPETVTERLYSIGDWFESAGDAIFGTRPWWVSGEGPTDITSSEFEEATSFSLSSTDIRFLRNEDSAYAFVMDWPEDDQIDIETSLNRCFTARERGDVIVDPGSVELMGAQYELDYEVREDRLRIYLPGDLSDEIGPIVPLQFPMSSQV